MGRLFFLTLPDALCKRLERDYGDADNAPIIDPSIPIPVELELDDEAEYDLKPEALSPEALLSGMIRLLIMQPDALHAAYYRALVCAVRPGIRAEFITAALVKAQNADYAMALEIIAALEGLFPDDDEVLLSKALILGERADALEQSSHDADAAWDEALAAYERALAQDPPFPNTLFNAAFFFMKRQDFGRARDSFRAYIDAMAGLTIDDDSDDAEQLAQAEALLQEIETHSLADAQFREACNAISAGDAEAALPTIRAFLERHSEVWNGWFLLGWALRELGRWADGAVSFRKALELGGDNSETRNELAICLMQLDDFSGARKELETALREEPENVKLISNLGVVAMRQGNNDQAAAFFRAVLAIEPDDPVAKEYFAKV
ncbi:MAG: tetratricopeptide repeat protein [Treponema sp.]|jgi:Tfp pilus assembly protein PilF|nr:tetratricopeptide repeat protein [Treponema sp.]